MSVRSKQYPRSRSSVPTSPFITKDNSRAVGFGYRFQQVSTPIPMSAFHNTASLPSVTDFVPHSPPIPKEKPKEFDRLKSIELVENPLPFIQVGVKKEEAGLRTPCPFTLLPNSLTEMPEIEDEKETVSEPMETRSVSKTIVLQLLARKKAECS
jgi:hypothetical protein